MFASNGDKIRALRGSGAGVALSWPFPQRIPAVRDPRISRKSPLTLDPAATCHERIVVDLIETRLDIGPPTSRAMWAWNVLSAAIADVEHLTEVAPDEVRRHLLDGAAQLTDLAPGCDTPTRSQPISEHPHRASLRLSVVRLRYGHDLILSSVDQTFQRAWAASRPPAGPGVGISVR